MSGKLLLTAAVLLGLMSSVVTGCSAAAPMSHLNTTQTHQSSATQRVASGPAAVGYGNVQCAPQSFSVCAMTMATN